MISADVRNLRDGPHPYATALRLVADCAARHVEALDQAPDLTHSTEGNLRLALKQLAGER